MVNFTEEAVMQESLSKHVADYVRLGCVDKSKSLGICQMPAGYALMLDADYSHFFWLRNDGQESVIHWNKWAVYRGAKKDSLNR